jgi:hypothetical protein
MLTLTLMHIHKHAHTRTRTVLLSTLLDLFRYIREMAQPIPEVESILAKERNLKHTRSRGHSRQPSQNADAPAGPAEGEDASLHGGSGTKIAEAEE